MSRPYRPPARISHRARVEPCYRQLAAAIREWRRYRGVSQEALAGMVGWSRTHMVNVEQASTRVHLPQVALIARHLRAPDLLDFRWMLDWRNTER